MPIRSIFFTQDISTIDRWVTFLSARLEPKPVVKGRPLDEVLIRAIISQHCTDKVTQQVFLTLKERSITLDSFKDARLEKELLTILRPSGCYHRKYRTIRSIASMGVTYIPDTPQQASKTLLQIPGLGLKTVNLVLTGCYTGDYAVIDVNVLNAYRVATGFQGSPVALYRKLNAMMDPSRAALFCRLLWTQRKTVCERRNCKTALCDSCAKFYQTFK